MLCNKIHYEKIHRIRTLKVVRGMSVINLKFDYCLNGHFM